MITGADVERLASYFVRRSDARRYPYVAVRGFTAAAIHEAVDYANTSGRRTVFLPSGTYVGNVDIAHDYITLLGAGVPFVDAVNKDMYGGTIVQGRINCNNKKGVAITNLGVDVSGSAIDGITSGLTSGTVWLEQKFHNLAILGTGWGNGFHALVMHSGSHNEVDNVRCYHFSHGVAARCQFTNISNIFTYECNSSSITIKAGSGSGSANFVNVNNSIAYGGANNTGGPITIMSDFAGLTCSYVNVSNAQSWKAHNAAISIIQNAGTLAYINISNVVAVSTSTINTTAAFDVQSGMDITFTNCQAIDPAGYGFRNVAGTRVSVHSSRSYSAGVAASNGVFDVAEIVVS